MNRFFVACAIVLAPLLASAQFTIEGKIVDGDGSQLVGAAVGIVGEYRGTFSSIDGSFALEVPTEGKYTLHVRYIGFTDQKIEVKAPTKQPVEITMERAPYMVDEVTISSTRATEQTPIAYTDMDAEDIAEENLGQDLPYLLRLQPSVVVTSDAGAGVGYTGIRIRGSDPTRVNVTVNGIPLNDAESHGVFWVDLPDIASSSESIQIQRGVGTSTNGAGAFGGSINLSTSGLNEESYANTAHSYGSFNTRKHNLSFGSGLIKDHWTFDGRISQISSDGYIDRATSDLQSYYLSGAYTSKSTSVRANIFSGHETTYQAWWGVPKDSLETNRTFNPATYKNEVDDYTQTHYQLLLSQQIGKAWTMNAALHYTKGYGYYENYEYDATLDEFGIGTQLIGGDTIPTSDLIQRRWLDNDFYGGTWSLNYNSNGRLKLHFGGAANQYVGRHFGEVIWARFSGSRELGDRYYDNDAEKNDINTYAKAYYQASKRLNIYGDVQYRYVNYFFTGLNADGNAVDQQVHLHFLNPKGGFTYNISNQDVAYASLAVGNKEPNRNDYTESSPQSRPTHETLYDYEAGYKRKHAKYAFGANLYYMDYTNQLALSGQVNDVGAYSRINIPKSYRAGLELEWGWKPWKWLEWQANATLSQNKVVAFTEYIDNWETWGQDAVEHSNTDLAFSPSIIAANDFTLRLFDQNGPNCNPEHSAYLSLITKYVGDQFIDNTSDQNAKLDAYMVHDIRLRYRIKNAFFSEMDFNILMRNVANELYSSNAWVYRYRTASDASPSLIDGYYPQAGRHYLVGLTISI